MLIQATREQSCDGEVRRGPGIEAALFQVGVPCEEIGKEIGRIVRGLQATLKLLPGPAHVFGGGDAMSAHDVRVGKTGEKAEIDRKGRPFRIGPARGRGQQRRGRDQLSMKLVENDADAVALRPRPWLALTSRLRQHGYRAAGVAKTPGAASNGLRQGECHISG